MEAPAEFMTRRILRIPGTTSRWDNWDTCCHARRQIFNMALRWRKKESLLTNYGNDLISGQGGHLHCGSPDGLLVQDPHLQGLVAHHRHLHHVRVPRVQVMLASHWAIHLMLSSYWPASSTSWTTFPSAGGITGSWTSSSAMAEEQSWAFTPSGQLHQPIRVTTNQRPLYYSGLILIRLYKTCLCFQVSEHENIQLEGTLWDSHVPRKN